MIPVKVDTKLADQTLKDLQKELSPKQIIAATRIALNDSVRKGKTEVKKSILSIYNMKSSRIDDSNRKKGLSVKFSQGAELSAEVDAGHIPVNLSEFPTKFKGDTLAQAISYSKTGKIKKGRSFKRSTSAISVAILKNAGYKTIKTAFTIGVATHAATGQQFTTPAIFARGKKGKPSFEFGKKRYPIDSMSSVSVATAALNIDAQSKVQPIVSKYYEDRLQYQLKRQIEKVRTSSV